MSHNELDLCLDPGDRFFLKGTTPGNTILTKKTEVTTQHIGFQRDISMQKRCRPNKKRVVPRPHVYMPPGTRKCMSCTK